MISSMKSIDITPLWLEGPHQPSRRVVVYNQSMYVDITSGYFSDHNRVRVYMPLARKFRIYEIQYDFPNPDLNEDREFILLVREEALG